MTMALHLNTCTITVSYRTQNLRLYYQNQYPNTCFGNIISSVLCSSKWLTYKTVPCLELYSFILSMTRVQHIN